MQTLTRRLRLLARARHWFGIRQWQAAELASVRQHFPDAAVMLYLKRGQALAREIKWLGSYRYAVINLGGASEEILNRRHAEIQRMLQLS